MSKAIVCRRTSITVGAGADFPVHAAGDFLFIEVASGDMTVRARSMGAGLIADGALVRTAASYKWKDTYDQLTFTNSSGGPLTATIWTGEGEASLVQLAGSLSVANWAGATAPTSPADVAISANSSLDLAADSTIRERILEADSSNTGELCVRDQTGTTSAGKRLGPAHGLSLVLGNNGALRIRNNNAAAQTIHQLNNLN